ncbi:chromosomal replication initiation protein DnaA [Lewinella sp. 4G2]|nr:chromosomal replication initiation protein DnaA [Lewinella sp. 4G2]
MDSNTDHKGLWSQCLQTISQTVSGQAYETWFAPITPVKLVGNELTIQVPHRLFYEWLEEHYVEVLKTSLNTALGEPGRLQYRINPVKNKVRPTLPQKQGKVTEQVPLTHENMPGNPFVIPGVARPRIPSNLNKGFTFKNFVEGDCNSLARNAAKAVADNPTQTAFNPLVIHGKSGLGKTHLLHAIGNYVNEKYPDKAVLFVGADTFTQHLIDSIASNSTNDLLNWYQNVDILLVDDIQQLVNRKKTQDIFFNLFNVLRQNNKAIVMTCDRPIIELDIEERLRSRFQWGLSADLSEPALETRMAILTSKAHTNNVELPTEVAEFICFHIKNNIRQLEGILHTMVMKKGVAGKEKLDIDLAKEVLRSFVSDINREVTPEVIQKAVADHFNLDVEKIKSTTRRRQVVLARQISMFLVKQHTDNSLKKIGQLFGNRDHSTVIYSLRAVEDLVDTNDEVRRALAELERKIRIGKGEG